MHAIAPGKLILSGEHAVVFGKPALVTAINRSARVVITPEDSDLVSFDLQDLKENSSFTLRALHEMKSRILRNYSDFLEGRLRIREVLYKPVELFEFAFITVLDGLHLKLTSGLNIRLHSDIPIGCGMGSSAATILSVVRAIGHYFRVEFRPDWYLRYSMEAENMQHGHSSGVDPYISLHGGCVKFQNGKAEKMPLPRAPMFLANSGTPSTTTGECVAQVGGRFSAGNPIWDRFERVTLETEQALRANDFKQIQSCVRQHHRLLTDIGVVPEKVQSFIADIEAAGGAAKTTGAGSVSGESAGMVLIYSRENPAPICDRHGFPMVTVRGEPLGARIV